VGGQKKSGHNPATKCHRGVRASISSHSNYGRAKMFSNSRASKRFEFDADLNFVMCSFSSWIISQAFTVPVNFDQANL